MEEKGIRESFAKIKEDMLFLSHQLIIIKEEINEIREEIEKLKQNKQSADSQQIQQISSTNSQLYSQIKPYFNISKGNKGVPADSQQTINRQIDELKRTFDEIREIEEKSRASTKETTNEIKKDIEKENCFYEDKKELSKLSKIINNMKQDLKEKFRNLSKQEFIIFSAIYSLEEQSKEISYKDLAISTRLTESSIRDYIARLIHKGIPIIKEKINNKTVLLKISPELRNLATLDMLSKINSKQI